MGTMARGASSVVMAATRPMAVRLQQAQTMRRMCAVPAIRSAATQSKGPCLSKDVLKPKVLMAAASGDGSTSAPHSDAVSPQPQLAAPQRRFGPRLFVTLGLTVVTAVLNRLLFKAATVPLQNYVFFLAQLQTFAYVAIYVAVLAVKYRSGQVTRTMLYMPLEHKSSFLAIGFVEAVASLLGFVGAAKLPGVVLPLLGQTVLIWQVLLASVVLKKRLGAAQFLGVGLVLAGVCLAALPADPSGSPLAGIHPVFPALYVFSMLLPAVDTVLKESVFRAARAKLGTDLDLFVVNSLASLLQALFVFMLLPITLAVRGMSLADLPGYVARGAQCFSGLTPSCGSDCSGAPLLPLCYVALNLLFNVSALDLIRQAGNVAMSLVMSSVVPLTIYCFTIPMPFLPPSPPLGKWFGLGTATLLLGLLLFNAPVLLPALVRAVAGTAGERGKKE